MTDPVSLALVAVAGKAAGKFVEKAWDSGEKWIASYFENHREKAQKEARGNSIDFLNKLAIEIQQMEEDGKIKKQDIETALDHPDFSVVLQKAILSAAQTEQEEKHLLLAQLIANRLQSGPETVLALASKMACDAISLATSNQLRILGLQVNLRHLLPDRELAADEYYQWIEVSVAPFVGVSVSYFDLAHLEALSCGRISPIPSRLFERLTKKFGKDFSQRKILDTDLGKKIEHLWESGLNRLELTSVGQLIGIYVSRIITGMEIDLSAVSTDSP